MPPGRRGRPAGSTTRPKTPQQRLSFGPNATNKVTKPSPLAQDAKKKLSTAQKSKLEVTVDTEALPVQPLTPASAEDVEEKAAADMKKKEEEEEEEKNKKKSLPIRRNENAAAETKGDEKETEARKISDAQIKKYWLLKEEGRIAPRVHQQGLSVNEKVLREFDLSSQFGPCIGIPRIKRWKRADGLGQKPPLEVLAVLLKEEERSKGKEDVQRAYIDSLMGGKLDAEP